MIRLNRLLLVALAAFIFAGSASAQNAGTVTNHAFAIGKGAGTTGYTSLLCGSAQLAVGQSAADPICKTITGDVTISAAGVTAIGASKVTNPMLVNSSMTIAGHSVSLGASQAIAIGDLSAVADGTVASNLSGSSAPPTANSITSVLDKLFGTTQGIIVYRGSTSWAALAPGTSGNFLKTQGSAANPLWAAVPGGGDMLSSNNLSDVASAATARGNLTAAKSGSNSDITSLSGLTTPLSVAQGGTGDAGTSWGASTPAVTASSGTFTTASAAMRSKTIGKTFYFSAVVTITTVGTASGVIRVAMPVSAAAITGVAGASAAGPVLSANVNGNVLSIAAAAGTSAIAAGAVLYISGVLETT